jgi:hypothetical protein
METNAASFNAPHPPNRAIVSRTPLRLSSRTLSAPLTQSPSSLIVAYHYVWQMTPSPHAYIHFVHRTTPPTHCSNDAARQVVERHRRWASASRPFLVNGRLSQVVQSIGSVLVLDRIVGAKEEVRRLTEGLAPCPGRGTVIVLLILHDAAAS